MPVPSPRGYEPRAILTVVSFDLAIFLASEVATLDEARSRHEQLCDEPNESPPSADVARFLDDLRERWPGETDDELEESPWATWPLESQADSRGVHLNMVWQNARESAAAIAHLAERNGLVVYDPQADDLPTAPWLAPLDERASPFQYLHEDVELADDDVVTITSYGPDSENTVEYMTGRQIRKAREAMEAAELDGN